MTSSLQALAEEAIKAHNFVIEWDTTDSELAWLKEAKRKFPYVEIAQAILTLIKEKRALEEALRGIYAAHEWYTGDCPNNERDPVCDAIETAKKNCPLNQPGESP